MPGYMAGWSSIIGIPFGLIFQLLILVLFFLIIYWIFKSRSSNSAKDILEKRYAEGKITRKEYLQAKHDLK